MGFVQREACLIVVESGDGEGLGAFMTIRAIRRFPKLPQVHIRMAIGALIPRDGVQAHALRRLRLHPVTLHARSLGVFLLQRKAGQPVIKLGHRAKTRRLVAAIARDPAFADLQFLLARKDGPMGVRVAFAALPRVLIPVGRKGGQQ